MDLALSLQDLQALRGRARGKTSALRPAAESGPATAFDPRKSAQLSPDQTESLEALQRVYAGNLGAALQTRLQAPFELTFASLEQLSPGQFLEAREEPVYAACLGTAEAPALLALDAGLALALLDRLLGGCGKEALAARALTALENQVLQPVAALAGGELQATWQLTLPPADLSAEMALQELAGSADRLLVTRFEARFQELRGTLRMAFSSALWAALLRRLRPPEQPPNPRPAQHRERLRERLLEGRFPAEARLPRSSVSLRQLSELRVGDVVTLAVQASESLEVQVAGRRMFRAAPVACGSARGARVQALLAGSPKDQGERA